VEVRRIGNRRSGNGGDLGVGVDRHAAGLAVNHASVLKYVEAVLALTQDEAGGLPGDADAEEVVKRAKVLHGELSLEGGDGPLK
jgi:hypothetical protein